MFLVTSSEDCEDSLLGLLHWKTHVLFRFICFIYVYECTPVCIYVHHAVPGTPGGQKRGLFPLVTGVTDGYEPGTSAREKRCSKLPSHVSSSLIPYFNQNWSGMFLEVI